MVLAIISSSDSAMDSPSSYPGDGNGCAQMHANERHCSFASESIQTTVGPDSDTQFSHQSIGRCIVLIHDIASCDLPPPRRAGPQVGQHFLKASSSPSQARPLSFSNQPSHPPSPPLPPFHPSPLAAPPSLPCHSLSLASVQFCTEASCHSIEE